MLHIVCEYVVIHENMCPLSDGRCRIGAIHRQTHRCMFKCKTAAPMCGYNELHCTVAQKEHQPKKTPANRKMLLVHKTQKKWKKETT